MNLKSSIFNLQLSTGFPLTAPSSLRLGRNLETLYLQPSTFNRLSAHSAVLGAIRRRTPPRTAAEPLWALSAPSSLRLGRNLETLYLQLSTFNRIFNLQFSTN
jgi:hypothetical protein